MTQAIQEIGALGYDGVEMFDGNVADFADAPEELVAALEAANVSLAGVYTGGNYIYSDILPDELHRAGRAIDLAAQFGATSLVVGGGARRAAGTTSEDYERLAQTLDQITDLADAAGLVACYHPHLSTIAESPAEIDMLMAR